MNGSVFSLSKEVSYCDVKHRFSGHRSWITQNKYEGTFARVGVPNQANVISVGHSDYGLAEPAIDSAVSLALVTVFFFHSISNFDSKMYDRVIQKWLEKLIALYLNIEVTCFQQ